MKKIRIIIALVFAVTAAVFGVYEFRAESQKDEIAPQITADSDEITVSIKDGDKVLLKGMSASDNKDGDVTSSLVVASKSRFLSRGKIKVNYAAFDSKNNVGTYTRTVNYSDYTAPEFSLSEPLRCTSDTSKINYLSAISAEDCIDGDISNQIRVIYGDYQYSDDGSGSETVTYQVTNSAGDMAQIEVEYLFELKESYNTPGPALNTYLVYTDKGVSIDPVSYISGIWSSGKKYSFDEYNKSCLKELSAADVSAAADINYDVPGTYRVVYTLSETDPETGERTEYGRTTLYVVVKE